MSRRYRLIFRFAGIALMALGLTLAIIDKDPRPLHQPMDAMLIGFIALVISYLEERRVNRP